MTFTDWLERELDTARWVVAPRWSEKLRREYVIRLSQKQFTALKAEYQKYIDATLDDFNYVGSRHHY